MIGGVSQNQIGIGTKGNNHEISCVDWRDLIEVAIVKVCIAVKFLMKYWTFTTIFINKSLFHPYLSTFPTLLVSQWYGPLAPPASLAFEHTEVMLSSPSPLCWIWEHEWFLCFCVLAPLPLLKMQCRGVSCPFSSPAHCFEWQRGFLPTTLPFIAWNAMWRGFLPIQ